jgi:geranylgeranyl pyrophosphate synthase
MIRHKTGALISAACEAGAIVGGGAEKEISALRDFGMGIGIGFQIHDDVLNLRADVKKYGKEIGGDINEGKRTLMAIYTLSACTPTEKKLLINILDKPKNSPDEIRAAIEMIEKYGSIDRAAELSKGMIEEGKRGLKALPESKAKRLLLEIAEYLVKREL